MLSIKLFNAVLEGQPADEIRLDKTLPYGYLIEPAAAGQADAIIKYMTKAHLSGEQMNMTFHKSWQTIRDTPRQELLIHQLMHYFSTYGMQSLGIDSDYIYLPNEVSNVPELNKQPIQVIRAISRDALCEKCLGLLRSGIALKEETIDDLLALLDELAYNFESTADIKNKEALVKIAARHGVFPEDPVEFLRYLVYQSTGSTLLIKNDVTLEAIKSNLDYIAEAVEHFGLEKCAQIFNRFKPIWLAFKALPENATAINKISKLSKVHHKPLQVDLLNRITSMDAIDQNELEQELRKASNFRKIRLLYALNTRLNNPKALLYRVRNGTAYVKQAAAIKRDYSELYRVVYQSLIDSLHVKGKHIRYPDHVDYALPATEKMFIGNFPMGTKIFAKENLTAGIYWENGWGANDLDLSGMNLGKIGWDATYKSGSILYSGDITSAPNGATELLYVGEGLSEPTLAINNIYSGKIGCQMKVMVGISPNIQANYMLEPKELIVEATTQMRNRQMILGIFLPEENGVSYVLVQAGFGDNSVSSPSKVGELARQALFAQWSRPVSLRKVLSDAGAILTDQQVDIDLRPDVLEKDTIIKLVQ